MYKSGLSALIFLVCHSSPLPSIDVFRNSWAPRLAYKTLSPETAAKKIIFFLTFKCTLSQRCVVLPGNNFHNYCTMPLYWALEPLILVQQYLIAQLPFGP
jgi:hypothetical protein